MIISGSAYPTPWNCTVIKKDDCAAHGEECAHLGCCQDPGDKCFQEHPGKAKCRERCPGHWDCLVISVHESEGDGSDFQDDAWEDPEKEAEEINDEISGGDDASDSEHWRQGLQATHFWDCSGGSCDACVVQPWDEDRYRYAPHYAPTDPSKHGGPAYGEKLWLTGAASDKLTEILGPDSECCGTDTSGGGGCGQCLLVTAPESDHPDWLAVVMKKNRCPPHSYGCDKVHLDIAVPGFDDLRYSTGNKCGSHYTHLSKKHSGVCAQVAGGPRNCDCSQLPGHSPSHLHLREGCKLFKKWGWHQGAPKLNYRPVPCPAGFVEWVRTGNAFDHNGVIDLEEIDGVRMHGNRSLSRQKALIPQTLRMSTVRLVCVGVAAALAASGLAVGLRVRRLRQHASVITLAGSEEEGTARLQE